ncbi:NACHT domain-containing protein [Herbidospora cretacea]|uniref:NACHT domain-containing protein n=1 Tax=Herbidospora cretacea TaxID=28444 RepID=UPI000772DC90|nr:hypothetical protein [Herbidospora cretacea]
MSKLWRIILLTLAAADGLVLLPVLINIATGGAAPAWLEPYRGWVWSLVAVLAVIAIVFAVLQAAEKKPDSKIAGYVHPDYRGRAIANVHRHVTQRLDQSLVRVARARLDLDSAPDAVAPPPRSWHVTRGDDPWQPPAGATPLDVYNRLDGSMLILGAPGAGKTTMILELAEALLSRANLPRAPLPVVVELADWAVGERTFFGTSAPLELRTWLLRRIDSLYGIGDGVTDSWLADGRVALLLDGFDEVPAEHRARCVAEINALYERYPQVPLVVGSRVDEYEDLPAAHRFRLRGAVVIRPLTGAEVIRYLAEGGPRLRLAHQSVTHDPALLDLITAPLWLYVLIVGMTANTSGSAAPGRGALLAAYIDQVFLISRRRSRRYRRDQVLTWIAHAARLVKVTNLRVLPGGLRGIGGVRWGRLVTPSWSTLINREAMPLAACVWMTAAGWILARDWGVGWSVAGLLTFAGVLALGQDFGESPPDVGEHPGLTPSKARARVGGLLLGLLGAAALYGLGELVTTSRSSELIASLALILLYLWSAAEVFRDSAVDASLLFGGSGLVGAGATVVAFLTPETSALSYFLGVGVGFGASVLGSTMDYPIASEEAYKNKAGYTPRVVVLALAGAAVGFGAALSAGAPGGAGGWLDLVLLAVGAVTSFLSLAIYVWDAPGLIGWWFATVEGLVPLRWGAFMSHAADLGLLQREGKGYRFQHLILSDYLAGLPAREGGPPPGRSSPG